MKFIHAIAVAIALAAICNGALATRFLIQAPEIYRVADMPLVQLALSIPALVAMAWVAVRIMGSYASVPYCLFLALGWYATFYGGSELAFHAANHKPVLSSLTVFLLGVVTTGSLLTARYLFWGREQST